MLVEQISGMSDICRHLISHENQGNDIDFHPSMFEATPHGGVS
jgi:hypothetical protein